MRIKKNSDFYSAVSREITEEAASLVEGLDCRDFEDMEREAREVALTVMDKALERRFNSDHSDKSEEGEFCGCGRMAEYAGRRKKQFTTVLGSMVLERAWYHCESCNEGFAPRDRELGFSNGSLSPGVLRMVGISAAQTSFGEASGLIEDLAGLEVESKQVERYAEREVPTNLSYTLQQMAGQYHEKQKRSNH